jgi:hypothetical protein
MKTDYIETKPLITIRAKLPKKIMKFIRDLKSRNDCSRWVSEAILEKYEKENKR